MSNTHAAGFNLEQKPKGLKNTEEMFSSPSCFEEFNKDGLWLFDRKLIDEISSHSIGGKGYWKNQGEIFWIIKVVWKCPFSFTVLEFLVMPHSDLAQDRWKVKRAKSQWFSELVLVQLILLVPVLVLY